MYGTIDEWALPTTSAAIDIAVDTAGTSSFPPGSVWVVYGAQRIGEQAALGVLYPEGDIAKSWPLGTVSRYGDAIEPGSLHVDERGHVIFLERRSTPEGVGPAVGRFLPDRGVLERWPVDGDLGALAVDATGRIWVANASVASLDCLDPAEGRLTRWPLHDLALGPGRLVVSRDDQLSFTAFHHRRGSGGAWCIASFDPKAAVLIRWRLPGEQPCSAVTVEGQAGGLWLILAGGQLGRFDPSAEELRCHRVPNAAGIADVSLIYDSSVCCSDFGRGRISLLEPRGGTVHPLPSEMEILEANTVGISVHRSEPPAGRLRLPRTRLHLTGVQQGDCRCFSAPHRRPMRLAFSAADDGVYFTQCAPARLGRLNTDRPLSVWAALLKHKV